MAQISTITAVISRFTSDPTLSVFANRIWLDELPEKNIAGADIDIEVNGPFVTLLDGGSTLDYCSEVSYVEKRGLTFLVFNVGAEATDNVARLVRRVFRIYNTRANGIDWLKCELTSEKLMIKPEPTKSGRRVFVAQLDYDVERMGDASDW